MVDAFRIVIGHAGWFLVLVTLPQVNHDFHIFKNCSHHGAFFTKFMKNGWKSHAGSYPRPQVPRSGQIIQAASKSGGSKRKALGRWFACEHFSEIHNDSTRSNQTHVSGFCWVHVWAVQNLDGFASFPPITGVSGQHWTIFNSLVSESCPATTFDLIRHTWAWWPFVDHPTNDNLCYT